MADISRDDLVPQLRKLLGFRGAVGFDLAQTIVPVANVADVDSVPWHTKVGGAGYVSQGAVALQFASNGLGFPLGATIPKEARIVVRWISPFAVAAGSQVLIWLGPVSALPAFSAAGAPTSWDSLPGASSSLDVIRPSANLFVQSSVAGSLAGLVTLIHTAPATTFAGPVVPLLGPWVIAPGNILVVQNLTLNQTLQTNFFWDEYYVG